MYSSFRLSCVYFVLGCVSRWQVQEEDTDCSMEPGDSKDNSHRIFSELWGGWRCGWLFYSCPLSITISTVTFLVFYYLSLYGQWLFWVFFCFFLSITVWIVAFLFCFIICHHMHSDFFVLFYYLSQYGQWLFCSVLLSITTWTVTFLSFVFSFFQVIPLFN